MNIAIAELLVILDSFSTGYPNTTSTYIGMEDGGSGEPQSGGLLFM